MTAHWLDPTSRKREHAVLACRRLQGHHTFDILAAAMADIHFRFNIQDKVTRTTTDNAANFKKAFVQFSSESDVLPDVVEPEADVDLDDEPDLQQLLEDPEPTAADEVEFVQLESVFREEAAEETLPKHMRCAAHTMNLMATVDADKALDNGSFKAIWRKTMSKAQAFWNVQNRSTVAADLIQEELKRRLKVPNATRWNSTYDSVSVLNTLLEESRLVLFSLVLLTYCS